MHTAAATPSDPPAARRQTLVCRAIALALAAYFLASVAGFYHRGTGFTALICFADAHDYEVPAMAQAPHFHVATGGYDGQFYAQLALVPLLKDPAIDRALDNPAYRARRILFSWTAYVAGLGRPAWIIQIYAVQNVLCWLLLAWLLRRWIPPDTPRGLALWTACLFSQGLLASVRLALTDGPAMLMLTLAAMAGERGRVRITAAILGAGALGRETTLLALTLFRVPRRPRDWFVLTGALAIAVVPLLLWQDYLWSIYRSTSWANQSLLNSPVTGMLRKWRVTVQGVQHDGITSPHMWALAATLGLTAQAAFVLWRRTYTDVWWRIATPFAVLMIFLAWDVWGGFPGAASRVLVPLTIGFNVLLRQYSGRVLWAWYALGNIALIYAPAVLRSS